MEEERIKIHVSQDIWLIASDWALFGFSTSIVIILVTCMLNVITRITNESSFLIALIVFMFTITKLINFIRIPHRYSTSGDIVQEIDYVMEKRK